MLGYFIAFLSLAIIVGIVYYISVNNESNTTKIIDNNDLN